MPRPMWTGAISFGLVSVPVKLFNAVSRKSVSFNQIDTRTNSRIKLKKVSAADGSDVPDDAIVKGYDMGGGQYVLIEPGELDAFEAAASRSIEIEEFVDLGEIDPIYYDSQYYLAPDKTARKPYALLAAAMEAENKVGVARFVMRSKQYVAAIRAVDGRLVLSTMVYADEIVPPATVAELDDVADADVSERELNMARQLVNSLEASFEPEKYHDAYREQVLDLIERKAAGETVEPVAPAASAPKVVDLMAALEASVREAKAARSRHPTARPAEESAEPVAATKARRRGSKAAGDDVDIDVDLTEATAGAPSRPKAPARKKRSA